MNSLRAMYKMVGGAHLGVDRSKWRHPRLSRSSPSAYGAVKADISQESTSKLR